MSYLFSFLLFLWCFIFSSSAHADGHPVINEFLPHPSTGNKEWVELYVPDSMDVTNYWIDDDTDFANDSGSSTKKQIVSPTQGSDSRHVVFELSSSMFNNGGDTVALFTPDGALVDQYTYSSDPGADISIGRTPDGTGDFQVLIFATHGSPNSSPKPADTATPAPTDKPTTIPKPTRSTSSGQAATPKPAKSAPVPTAVSYKMDQQVLSDSTVVSNTKKSNVFPQVSSAGAYPTSIFATNTKAPDKKSNLPKKQLLIKSATSNLPQVIAFSIGGLLFAGCGIFLFLKKRGMLPWGRHL